MRCDAYSVPFQFRTTPQFAEAMREAARHSHQSVSELARQAILSRVRELGVPVGESTDARAA